MKIKNLVICISRSDGVLSPSPVLRKLSAATPDGSRYSSIAAQIRPLEESTTIRSKLSDIPPPRIGRFPQK
jgi:hypothetical protein